VSGPHDLYLSDILEMVVGTVLSGPTVGAKCSRRVEVDRNLDELLMASLQALVDQLLENE